MSPALAIATYLLFWAISGFLVLPFGVRTTQEAGGEPVPGEADSAPANPILRQKLVWMTVIATILFALFYANFVHGWVTLDDIPGWQHTGPYAPN